MAEELEAGAAYIQLMASGRGLQRDTEKQVKKVKAPDILAKIDVKLGDLEKKVATAKAKLASVASKGADPQVGLDIAELEAKAAVVRQRLEDLRGRAVTPKVTADIASAEAQLGRITTKLADLNGKRSTARVDAETTRAQADVTRLESQITRLRGQRAQVVIDSQGAGQTKSQLDDVARKTNSLNGKRANVNVSASGASSAVSNLLAVAGALGAIASAAPAAVGALAAVAGAAGAAGQGAAAALAGFAGIGDALTAVQAQEKSAATASTQAAGQRVSSARQVASAQRALQQAQAQQARTAIQGAQQVASAERALGAARAAYARTAIQGAQQVAAARRALASAELQAARSVEDAQRSYTRAVQNETYAQEDVARARKDARRALADLQLQMSGAALSEERAALNLEKARRRLAAASAAGVSGIELQDVDLDFREAQQSLAETQSRFKNLTEDSAEWARTGVEGSQQVVSAQRALQAAQEATADSARQVARAQFDGTQQVQEAQIALAQTIQQAGWAQEDAARGVQDAEIALADARQQAAWANEDAAAAVADAQRALAEAYTDAGTAGAAGADQAAYALSKLSPAGREFVRFMTDEWNPAVERVTHATAEELLPRVQRAMKNLLSLEGLVTQGLTGSARVLGDLAVRGSELATSAPFRADFATIMASNTRNLESYGNAGLSMFGIVTDLLTVAAPYGEEFARLTDYTLQAAESWIIGARQSGELDRILRSGVDTFYFLVDVLGQVAGGVWGLTEGLAPLGGLLLTVLGNAAEFIGDVAGWDPILTSVVGGLGLAYIGVSKLGTAMAATSLAQGASGVRAFANVLGTVLNPAALYATTGVQNLGLGAATMATRVGVADGKALSFGNAVSRTAAALPLLGVAITGAVIGYDAMTTSSSEAADALLQGGAGAASMRAELAKNDATQREYTATMGTTLGGIREWVTGMLGSDTTTKQANASLEERIATMGPLEAAQARATLAQSEYELALRETGPTSQRTTDAQGRLAFATGEVERAQEEARRATMTATEALKDQQDQILGSINSRLAYESATRGVARAQQEYAKAIADSGPASFEAQEALGRLQEAQTRQAEAARKAAEDEAKRKGVVDTSIASNDAYARSIGDMVAKTQGQLTPALQQMVSSLGQSELAAAGAKVEFNAAGQAVATFPNGKTVVLDANTSPVYPALQAVKLAVDSTRGTIGVDADPGPGRLQVGNFKFAVDATRGVMSIDGNITPAEQQRLGIQAKTDGTTGVMFIDGNPVPCDGRLNGMRGTVDRTTGIMTIDADNRPGDQRRRDLEGGINRTLGTATATANTQPAYDGVSSWLRWLSYLNPIVAVRSIFTGAGGGPVARAEGGPIEALRAYAAGGAIDVDGGLRGYAAGAGGSRKIPRTDTVPAMLTPGEFVERRAAVQRLGMPFFAMTNEISASAAPAVRDAAFAALRGQPWLPSQSSADIVGLADRMGERRGEKIVMRGYAGGGGVAAGASSAATPSAHRYDLAAAQVTGQRPVQVASTGERGGNPSALVGTVENHFHGDNQEGVAVRELTHTLRVISRGGRP